MKTLIKSVLVSVVALLLSVRAWGDVSFDPASVIVDVGWSETVTLSGTSPSGWSSSEEYVISTPPNPTYASASISGKTLTITGNGTSGDTTCTIKHTYSSWGGTKTETGTLTITVRALAQESRTATMMRGEGLPITADDLDGAITRVKSDNDAVATVTLANGVATITGVRAGTTTVRVRTDSKEYVYTVTVNPLTIRLCVGDVVKLNYDFGGTGNDQGSLLSVTTSGGAVAATCQTQGSSQTSNGTRYYRSGYLQITANAVGTQTVTLNRRIRNQGSTYNAFDTVAVEVLPAREILKGASTDFTCLADVDCAGNANWTALSQSPAGIVSASYGTQTTTSAMVAFTGTKRGTTTVTAKNVKGSNNNLSGAEYQLEVKVTLPKVEGDAITVYEGESVTLADASVDKAWTATSLDTGIATVPASGAAGTGAVITGVKAGTTTVEVEHNDVYYSYEVTVQAKPVVNLTTRFTCVGESVDIPASDFGNLAWKNATSGDTLKGELVATSGTAGTGVTVRGVNPGETLITFETADTIYKAHVQVNSKAQIDLDMVQVRVGQSIVITDTRIAGAWKGASSADAEKVTVDASETGEAGTGPTVTGVDETDEAGVVVTFNDAKRIYTVHVQVFDKLRIDGGVKTVVPPPMNEGDESFEAPGFIPVDPAWGSDYEVSIGNTSFATFEETDEGIIVYGLPQGRRGDVSTGDHVGTQDNGAMTTLTVTTEDAVYTYTIYVVSDETHVVNFCEGDKTQIWYNDTTGSKVWFLLVNDQRFELDQRGTGEQMHVTLTAQDEQISYIIATADMVGDPEHGDLVVISDGVKYYTYRMSCSPARVIEVGGSTDMICRTVAVNKWRVDYMSDQWGYTNFINVVCSPNESGDASHFTTATITGRAIAGETYVLVRDDQHKADEHNAQGAVYTLKTRVVGAPDIPVQISPGASADVGWENWADPEATLTIEIDGADVYTAQFVDGHDHGNAFVMNLSASESATYGQSAVITVKAGDIALARYTCSIMPPFAVKEGTTAPGYLYGVNDTPWVSSSSNPSVITVTPTKYNRMYSAEAKFLKEGWAELHSTNAYYQAGYFFIRATVYDTHITDVDMTAGSTMNVLVTHSGSFAGEWTWSCDNADLLDSVALTPDPTDPLKVTAAITAKSDVKGAVNVTVTSGYHTETIRVYVSPDDGREKVRVNGEITLVVGMEQEIPAEATAGGAWTATSMNTDLVTVTASGGQGQPATITGVSAGTTTPDGKSSSQTTVVVENETTIYIYNVSVVKPTTESLDLGVINVGETRTMNNLSELFEGEIQSIAALDGNLTLEVNWDKANNRTTTTGNQEGETTIVVKTDSHIYNLHVKVRKNHIDKHIKLAIGEDGSKTTYSFTFDRLEGISPTYVGQFNVTTNGGVITYAKKNNRYSIERTGNIVTFIPGEIEFLDDTNDTVVFLGQVDGLAFTTELHYWVMVEKAPNGQRVIQMGDKSGYIGYEGTDDVHVDPATGDIILVFTNANDVSSISVPSPWNVKMDILAIGGGGAGGSGDREGHNGGGGGAGGFTYVANRVLVAGTFGVVVGKAGTSGGVPCGD